MKLISYSQGANPRPGVALTDQVGLDILAADPTLPDNWHALFSELDSIRPLVEKFTADAESWTPEQDHLPVPLFSIASVKLLPPILLPSKIIAVGLNYRDHAAEQNRPLPETPLLFSKAPSCMQAPFGPIALDDDLVKVDAEAELALVISRPGRGISEQDAHEHIAGYTCFNDVSDREAQYQDKQWFRGKSIDTGGPCGPWIVTPDELPEQAMGLKITAHWNGECMQSSNTDQLIFTPHFLVSYISRHMTLFPGDIISTGTPGGVGVFREPPVFLKPGDVVDVEIEKIGKLTSPVISW